MGDLIVGRQLVPITKEAVLGIAKSFSLSARSLEGNLVAIGPTQLLFQALGHLWLVLVLREGANIAEGLTALALISDVLQRPSILPTCTIASAHEHALDIVAAIDEVFTQVGIPEGTAEAVVSRLTMRSSNRNIGTKGKGCQRKKG
eukprot:gnl/Chilomastix_caulleri/4275.p1 GENE.gnl/Chilomastix_caulleri/4275~~gnl/Chilomastix_caulleri/4275.p1  ORF type:complete len:162 (+),score=12.74 gnl/Chilomastix_caulleri/4275:51-488(+)